MGKSAKVYNRFCKFLSGINTKQRRRRRVRIGALGEFLAAQYLRFHGFTVIGKNLRFKRGEIDLLVRRKKTLRVIEVRTITTPYLHSAQETFSLRKQQQVRYTTRMLQTHLATLNKEQNPLHMDFLAIRLCPWWKPTFLYLNDVEGLEGVDFE
jgi:putative endonuclease